jgi:hypothetical protein
MQLRCFSFVYHGEGKNCSTSSIVQSGRERGSWMHASVWRHPVEVLRRVSVPILEIKSAAPLTRE